jgi:hypothetical protein
VRSACTIPLLQTLSALSTYHIPEEGQEKVVPGDSQGGLVYADGAPVASGSIAVERCHRAVVKGRRYKTVDSTAPQIVQRIDRCNSGAFDTVNTWRFLRFSPCESDAGWTRCILRNHNPAPTLGARPVALEDRRRPEVPHALLGETPKKVQIRTQAGPLPAEVQVRLDGPSSLVDIYGTTTVASGIGLESRRGAVTQSNDRSLLVRSSDIPETRQRHNPPLSAPRDIVILVLKHTDSTALSRRVRHKGRARSIDV